MNVCTCAAGGTTATAFLLLLLFLLFVFKMGAKEKKLETEGRQCVSLSVETGLETQP